MTLQILTVAINTELDVVTSRQRAREIAAMCGFGAQDQARIATAAAEMARNAYSYASHGTVEFAVDDDVSPQMLAIRIEDKGPGIDNLELVLSGRQRTAAGPGLGIPGARRLMDQCEITSAKGQGTLVTLKKQIPREARALSAGLVDEFKAHLAPSASNATLSEVQQQNRELLATLAELKARQEELLLLTRELEDTNRGVVALYAELDEKAVHLRRADETKSRFLSNMSHEFRTPLNSIRALSKLLLERIDGDLGEEQEKQVKFILNGAESLSEMVNDLLDLAKIEAGKVDVQAAEFSVMEMFSALRGMLRPLLGSESVRLLFELPGEDIRMHTDEGKVSQILRNFISNALKFTEAGTVSVCAALLPETDAVIFSVTDTGLGIAPENQEVIFEEFSQVENRLQHRIKGTGLGLPLCRNLANLLGGAVTLQSTVGQGSTFSVIIPLRYDEGKAILAETSRLPRAHNGKYAPSTSIGPANGASDNQGHV